MSGATVDNAIVGKQVPTTASPSRTDTRERPSRIPVRSPPRSSGAEADRSPGLTPTRPSGAAVNTVSSHDLGMSPKAVAKQLTTRTSKHPSGSTREARDSGGAASPGRLSSHRTTSLPQRAVSKTSTSLSRCSQDARSPARGAETTSATARASAGAGATPRASRGAERAAAPKSAPLRQSNSESPSAARRSSTARGTSGAAAAAKRGGRPSALEPAGRVSAVRGPTAEVRGGEAVLGLESSQCQYSVVSRARDRLGWAPTREIELETTTVVWHDDCLKPAMIRTMRETGVRWNHLPGIESICTKCGLQQTIGRVAAAFPKHFKFFPRSWSLPVQWIKLEHYMKTTGAKKGVTLIVKPNTLSRGRGIYLTQKVPPRSGENLMVQVYVERPLLISGLKFDLRMYVLITDIRCGDGRLPRVFLHHEGLARFCTTPYEEPTEDNLGDNTRHLSNYSVNKWSAEYVKSGEVQADLDAMCAASEAAGGLMPKGGEYLFSDGGKGLDEPEMIAKCRASQEGSKWTLTAFAQWAFDNGHDASLIWKRCCDLAARTALAASVSTMATQYNQAFGESPSEEGLRCFELLGVDVLLDQSLRPHLLEVNMSPSIGTDTALDLLVKEPLIQEALLLAATPLAPPDVDPDQWRDTHETKMCRGFHRVLPPRDPSSKRAAVLNEIAGYSRIGAV